MDKGRIDEGPRILGDDSFTMDDSYSRQDALFDLITAENTLDDARDNLEVIQSNIREDENLMDATAQFLRIFRAQENPDTREIQSHYVIIGNSLKPGESRKMATDEFISLIMVENSPAFAVSAFLIIRSHQKPSESITGATREFLRLLKARDSQEADSAKTHFVIISNSLRPGESRQYATSQMLKLIRADYCLEAPEVGRYYQMIDQSLKPGESRGEVTTQFIKLLGTPRGASDAAVNFRLIRACQRDGESLMDAIGQFNRLLEIEGYQNIEKVRLHFQLIDETLRQGESRSSAMDCLIELTRKTDDVDKAIRAYQLIHSFLQGVGDRPAMTWQFLEILDSLEGGDRLQRAGDILSSRLGKIS